MTEALARNRRTGSIPTASIACSRWRATSSRSGPGLGQAPATREFIRQLVDRATMPLVIDADGLNAFAGDPDRLAGREGRDVIITPHPGEMARLVGMSTDEVQASRLEIARNFAVAHHVLRRAEGPPHAHRDAGRQGVHQPDRQSRAWRPAAPATC